MKNQNKILLIIFFVTLIPTVYAYADHALDEATGYDKSIAKGNDTKAKKQLVEAIFFYVVAVSYTVLALLILVYPRNKIPYYILIIGTVILIILYYMRIYGIPVPFTDIVIKDYSEDWRDVVTKIGQQVMVIPLSILLGKLSRGVRNEEVI